MYTYLIQRQILINFIHFCIYWYILHIFQSQINFTTKIFFTILEHISAIVIAISLKARIFQLKKMENIDEKFMII